MLKDKIKSWAVKKNYEQEEIKKMQTKQLEIKNELMIQQTQIALQKKENTWYEQDKYGVKTYNRIVDYDAITNFKIVGDYLFVHATYETYRMHMDDPYKILEFLKGFQLDVEETNLISGWTWKFKVKNADKRNALALESFDFIELLECDALFNINLDEDVEINGLKNLIDAVKGEIDLNLNEEKIIDMYEKIIKKWSSHQLIAYEGYNIRYNADFTRKSLQSMNVEFIIYKQEDEYQVTFNTQQLMQKITENTAIMNEKMNQIMENVTLEKQFKQVQMGVPKQLEEAVEDIYKRWGFEVAIEMNINFNTKKELGKEACMFIFIVQHGEERNEIKEIVAYEKLKEEPIEKHIKKYILHVKRIAEIMVRNTMLETHAEKFTENASKELVKLSEDIYELYGFSAEPKCTVTPIEGLAGEKEIHILLCIMNEEEMENKEFFLSYEKLQQRGVVELSNLAVKELKERCEKKFKDVFLFNLSERMKKEGSKFNVKECMDEIVINKQENVTSGVPINGKIHLNRNVPFEQICQVVQTKNKVKKKLEKQPEEVQKIVSLFQLKFQEQEKHYDMKNKEIYVDISKEQLNALLVKINHLVCQYYEVKYNKLNTIEEFYFNDDNYLQIDWVNRMIKTKINGQPIIEKSKV